MRESLEEQEDKKGQAVELALARNASHFLLTYRYFSRNFLYSKNEKMNIIQFAMQKRGKL